jgi:hypothetical protein
MTDTEHALRMASTVSGGTRIERGGPSLVEEGSAGAAFAGATLDVLADGATSALIPRVGSTSLR